MPRLPPTVVPWLRRDQWPIFCSKFADPTELHADYDAWRRDQESSLAMMREAGFEVRPVDVDVHELAVWCSSRQRPIDAAALMRFAVEKDLAG